jgi:hypothetical protein
MGNLCRSDSASNILQREQVVLAKCSSAPRKCWWSLREVEEKSVRFINLDSLGTPCGLDVSNDEVEKLPPPLSLAPMQKGLHTKYL